MALGDKIRKYREEMKMSQENLAEKLGVSIQAVSKWETGIGEPSRANCKALAEIFNISAGTLLDEDPKDWSFPDRMFSEDHMYTYVKAAARAHNLKQTAEVLPYARAKHAGQTRKGKDKVPYIYHPLMLACHALALGVLEDEVICTALLHDVVEDCKVPVEELPVTKEVQEAVDLLTFRKPGDKGKYYEKIGKNRVATLVKVLDRCNNISSMGGTFTRDKLKEYVEETEKYVLPLLDILKNEYPEWHNQAFLLKYQILSVLRATRAGLM